MSLLKKLLGWGPPSSRRPAAQRPVHGDLMSVEALLEEGRRLARAAVLLKPTGTGEPVAMWHRDPSGVPDPRGPVPWLSIDTRSVPGLAPGAPPFVTIFTGDLPEGLVQAVPGLPPGLPLFAHATTMLPPIEAVFAFGSDRVAAWLAANGWSRTEPHDDSFPDRALVDAYLGVWFDEYPVYRSDPDVFAMLGGWPMPWPDDDWDDLLPEHLLALTVRDSEPWVEAWQHPSGRLHVIQRIT